MIYHKIKNVPDSVCEGCGQNWQSQCRAYEMPHSEEERKHRGEKTDLNCESRELVEKRRKDRKAFELKMFRAGW